MTYFVNDASQDVCFSGLKGLELFPAIAFYSSGRSASILSVSVSGVGPTPAAGAARASSTAPAATAVPAVPTGGPAAPTLLSRASSLSLSGSESPRIVTPVRKAPCVCCVLCGCWRGDVVGGVACSAQRHSRGVVTFEGSESV